MESEQLKQLLKEHVKQQKTTTGISNFLQEIFREAVQEMLKAEMDNHLGYEKHAPEASEFSNSRNGKTSKKVRSKPGELTIEVPRDREAALSRRSFQSENVFWKKSKIMCLPCIRMA